MVAGSGAIAEAIEVARQYAADAMTALAGLSMGLADGLSSLARSLVEDLPTALDIPRLTYPGRQTARTGDGAKEGGGTCLWRSHTSKEPRQRGGPAPARGQSGIRSGRRRWTDVALFLGQLRHLGHSGLRISCP